MPFFTFSPVKEYFFVPNTSTSSNLTNAFFHITPFQDVLLCTYCKYLQQCLWYFKS